MQWPVAISVGSILLSLSVVLGVPYLTYTDATVRSSDHPVLWGLLGLFVPFVGNLCYRVARPRLTEPTSPVPRRARLLSKWVRFAAAGLVVLLVVRVSWVTVSTPLSPTDGALQWLGMAVVGLGLTVRLTPRWPDHTVGSSVSDEPDRDRPGLSWRGKLAFLVGFAGILAASVSFASLFGALENDLVRLFILVLYLVGSGVGLRAFYRPYTSTAFSDVRPADEETRTGYAEQCRRFGCPVDGVWVADDLEETRSLADIAGVVRGNRHLFLDEAFFRTYDERERVAVFARETSLANSYYWLFSKLLVFLTLLAYYGIVAVAIGLSGGTNPFPDWPLVPELLLVVLLICGVWLGRRMIYRADRFSADQTSTETVVSALESLDAAYGDSKQKQIERRLLSVVWTRPSPRKRIERLRDTQ